MAKRCPAGKIWRDKYTRKGQAGKRVSVKGGCIKDRGRKGKGPKTLPKPKAGGLRGWTIDLPAPARRKILTAVSAKKGCRATLGDLNLLANITADKPTKRKARADYRWLRKQKSCKLKTK